MIYIIFIIFGLAPSIVWLLFYLKKDKHPESKRMVLKIFFYGIVAGIIAFLIEVYLSWMLVFFAERYVIALPILFFLINQFIIVALVEEFTKYFIVKKKALNSKEFDEPVDAMVYMIVAALGFAALENILILFTIGEPLFVKDIALISSFRFLGATFLHALASGVIGYFMGLSFYHKENRKKLIFKGLVIATILHGFFNISIIIIERGLIDQNMVLFGASFTFLIAMLTGTALFISKGFKELNHLGDINNN